MGQHNLSLQISNIHDLERYSIGNTLNLRGELLIKVYTWVKDSHGLFDYDYTNVTTTEFKLTSGACGKDLLLKVYIWKNEA